MAESRVADFFQEETAEALRAQVDWLVSEIGLDDGFFAKLLGTEKTAFTHWRQSQASLPPSAENTLRDLWRAVLHLLSFLGFETSRLRELFEETMPAYAPGTESPLTPPWRGASLKAYLERAGSDGIARLTSWVTGLRFGEPYAA